MSGLARLASALTAGVVLVATPAAAASACPTHRQVKAARAATAAYHDLAAAEADGYGLLKDTAGISCIADPDMGGAMGVHYVKADLVGDPVERVRTPEALVYRPGKDGRLHLAALEYVVLQADWDATHAQPPKRFGHRFSLTPAGNRYGLPAFYSLHAWVWFPNPAGRFAPYNPRVHCPAE